MRKIIILTAIMSAAWAGPTLAREPEISSLALQQIQARDFETTPAIVFPAVMTVLQDGGFRILTADKDTGLITAQGSSTAKTTFNIWWGLGKKKEVPTISAFIEQRGPNVTRARLNFVMSTGKSRNTFVDEKPITDPAAYRDAFEKIEKEIFVRQAMAAPTSAAIPASGSPEPTANPALAAPVPTAIAGSAAATPKPSAAKPSPAPRASAVSSGISCVTCR